MKIIYCLSGLFKVGGIERVLTNKANYWVQHGHEVLIITTDQCGLGICFPLDERVRHTDLGLNYEGLNGLASWKRLYLTEQLKRQHKQALTNILMQERADIVVSVGFHEMDFLPSIKDGSKKILELHSSKYTPILMYPKEQILKRLYGQLCVWSYERTASKYDRLIVLTEEERHLWGKNAVEVIPNICNISSPSPAKLRNKRAIAVGRLEYQKNFSELISLWKSISKQQPDWTLDIYGSGWMRGQLLAQIEREGVEHINLHEATPAIQEKMIDASLYLMTSHYEGLPMTLLEAQALGLPIVSYACPSGPKDIIMNGESGYLVESYNQQAFTTAVGKLMENEELRQQMGQKAYNSSQRFTEAAIMPQWEALFKKLITEK